MSSVRTLSYPVVALAVLALLFALKPRRSPDAPLEPAPVTAPPAPIAQYAFAHELPVPEPPEHVLRARFQTDRIQRWFDRIEWAPQELYSSVDRHLADLPPIEQRRYVELARARFDGDAILGAKQLTRLGLLDVPEAEDIVLEAALHPSAYVRMQATRALLQLDTPRAALRVERLLEDPDETVRREAVRALSEMETPEALAALQRYAERHPQDGIRHVLTRLAERSEDPSAVTTLRQYVTDPGDLGKIALKGLARFGDLLALDRVKALIDSPSPMDQQTGIAFLKVVPNELVDPSWVEPLLANPFGETRREAAELLAKLALAHIEPSSPVLERLLEKGTSDSDSRVYQASLVGLYALGRKDVAEPFLKAIESAADLNLSNAIELTTRRFKDERAAVLIRERLKREADPTARALLLIGLSNVGSPEDAGPFVDAIRAAGPNELRDAEGVPLSFRAAQLFPAVGKGNADALLQVLRDRPSTPAMLRALDALRGLPDAPCVDALLDLMVDASLPMEVRLAIVDTLPFVATKDTFERVVARSAEVTDMELGQHILRVVAGHL